MFKTDEQYRQALRLIVENKTDDILKRWDDLDLTDCVNIAITVEDNARKYLTDEL